MSRCEAWSRSVLLNALSSTQIQLISIGYRPQSVTFSIPKMFIIFGNKYNCSPRRKIFILNHIYFLICFINMFGNKYNWGWRLNMFIFGNKFVILHSQKVWGMWQLHNIYITTSALVSKIFGGQLCGIRVIQEYRIGSTNLIRFLYVTDAKNLTTTRKVFCYPILLTTDLYT